ncbi:MAG: A/G-specific adenine glycosylase [Phycisphaerae bacterium]|nr:A/G-specific adenine glycosylase [Phycisphaerae bacterium]
MKLPPETIASIRRRLIGWFARHQRVLPWRSEPTAYRVWLSEVMLQQTQVATALPYFERFMRAFPTVRALAGADLDDVLTLWAGLGYYSRARNLHRAATIIAHELGGRFPDTPAGLLALPGVGRYSAGAILSIAFNQPAPIVDGNVTRVLSRLFALRGDPRSPAGLRRLWSLAEQLVDPRRPGDFNQAMMELGAMVCTPATPSCGKCPVAKLCRALALGQPERFPPARRRSPVRAERWAVAVLRSDAEVLLVRREAAGRWGGLREFPGLVVPASQSAIAALRAMLRERLALRNVRLSPVGQVRHQLSHRDMTVEVFTAAIPSRIEPSSDARWVAPADLSSLAISRLTHKIARAALGA